MNDIQRTVLQKHTPDLVRDLIVTEHILGEMFQQRIFDQEMIEMIKAGKTHSEQIYKLLELLQKRGPEAFDSFHEILHTQYPWLAKLLHDSLVSESEKILNGQLKKEETEPLITPRSNSATIQPDADIKVRVSAFVTKQFGQVRRISNSDKRAIEVWMGRWLHTERKRIGKQVDAELTEKKETDVLCHQEVSENIFSLYSHLQDRQKKYAWLKPHCGLDQHHTPHGDSDQHHEKLDTDENSEDTNMEEKKDLTPDNITFKFLRQEVDETLAQMDYMQVQIKRCYDYISGNGGVIKKTAKDISILVHELCGEYRYKERELVGERQKIEKMLVELYNFSTKTNKLHTTINLQEHEILALKDQMNQIRADNLLLITELTELERKNLAHIEKQKTLDELRKTKDDLQVMIEIVNRENKDLKEQVGNRNQPLRNGLRTLGNNRRPLYNNTSNNMSRISPRKPVPKRRSNSFKT